MVSSHWLSQVVGGKQRLAGMRASAFMLPHSIDRVGAAARKQQIPVASPFAHASVRSTLTLHKERKRTTGLTARLPPTKVLALPRPLRLQSCPRAVLSSVFAGPGLQRLLANKSEAARDVVG